MSDNWVIWLGTTITWFLVMELPALLNRKDGDTLSEHVWGWLKVRDERPTLPTSAGRLSVALFFIWLAGHLSMGWWS